MGCGRPIIIALTLSTIVIIVVQLITKETKDKELVDKMLLKGI